MIHHLIFDAVIYETKHLLNLIYNPNYIIYKLKTNGPEVRALANGKLETNEAACSTA